jgi:hypothetical protein
VSSNKKECDRCRGLFEPLSRQASQNAMGPWYIRDEGNPFRPGCSYATIKALVSRKRIDGETVLRGPPSRQFWLRARNTPGVAHLLGECHACHKPASATAALCTSCGASFEVEDDRQFLGLAEVRALPTPGATAKPVKAAKTVIETVEQTPPIVEVAAATPEPRPEPKPERSYEPVRHPSRGTKAASSMSDEQIEEMLRKGRAYDRANSSTRVVTILIALAILGVVIAVGFAVVMMVQNLGAAPAAKPGAQVTPTGTTPATGR